MTFTLPSLPFFQIASHCYENTPNPQRSSDTFLFVNSNWFNRHKPPGVSFLVDHAPIFHFPEYFISNRSFEPFDSPIRLNLIYLPLYLVGAIFHGPYWLFSTCNKFMKILLRFPVVLFLQVFSLCINHLKEPIFLSKKIPWCLIFYFKVSDRYIRRRFCVYPQSIGKVLCKPFFWGVIWLLG